MEVEAVASTVGTVGEATASTVGMVGGATAGEVRGSPSGSGHTGAYMGGRMGGRMDIPMPIPIRIHPRSMSNPHSRYPSSRPRHHLSGTIVTIHRVIIPMSNSVPVAGERWPRAHNRWPEWESLTQPYPIVVEAERLGLFQGFPRQGIALALTRRCPGLPTWHKPTTAGAARALAFGPIQVDLWSKRRDGCRRLFQLLPRECCLSLSRKFATAPHLLVPLCGVTGTSGRRVWQGK
jgi:hypothetical protein